MKLIQKFQYGRPLVAQSDNTRVAKPIIKRKIKYKLKPGEFFFTDRNTGKKTLIKPKNETISADRRNTYQRKQNEKRTQQLHKQYEEDKKQEQAMKNLQGLLTFVSPSTYVGPVFNNNGKSYTENVMSGEGTGSTAGNVAVDMLTPFAVGGATKGIQAGNRLYRIRQLSKINQPKQIPIDRPKSLTQSNLDIRNYSPETSDQISRYIFFQKFYDNNLEFQDFQSQHNFFVEKPSVLVPVQNSPLYNYIQYFNKRFNLNTTGNIEVPEDNIFKENQLGLFNIKSKKPFVNHRYSDNVDNTVVHEAISHYTDEAVAWRPTNKPPLIFPRFVRRIVTKNKPTVGEVYQHISTPWPGFRFIRRTKNSDNYVDPNSRNWFESRATLNELRYQLFKENPDNYSAVLDKLPDQEIFKKLSKINNYGWDYNNLYQALPPRLQKSWANRIRYALKYLPATTPFTFPAIQNKNDR